MARKVHEGATTNPSYSLEEFFAPVVEHRPIADDTSELRVLCRPAREGDQAYVLQSWALYLCYAHGPSGEPPCTMPWSEHFAGPNRGRIRSCRGSRALVDHIAEHPAVRIAIAADPVDSDRILGWLAYTDSGAARVVHGAYTRDRIRNRGVMRQLAQSVGLADNRPLLYTTTGPSAKVLLEHTAAVHVPIEEFLSP